MYVILRKMRKKRKKIKEYKGLELIKNFSNIESGDFKIDIV